MSGDPGKKQNCPRRNGVGRRSVLANQAAQIDLPLPAFFVIFFAGLVFAVDARRFSVRFFAAASDAFFARAERSSGVMVSRLRLPPREPMAAIARRIIAGVICLPIPA
jgi:hypothetical protein